MENQLSTSDYEYKDVPLSKAILENLFLLLFHNRLSEAKTMYEESLKYHVSHGGKKPTAKGAVHTYHRALDALVKRGLASSPTRGYWRIGEELDTNDAENLEEDREEAEDLYIEEEQEAGNSYLADVILGTGSKVVYLYYLPLYRQFSENKSENFWPCKIGRTDGDPLSRVLTQASTALPEVPHIALIIRTDLPNSLEHAIHQVLTLRNRKIEDNPGNEWYLTSPDEVISIYNFIIDS